MPISRAFFEEREHFHALLSTALRTEVGRDPGLASLIFSTVRDSAMRVAEIAPNRALRLNYIENAFEASDRAGGSKEDRDYLGILLWVERNIPEESGAAVTEPQSLSPEHATELAKQRRAFNRLMGVFEPSRKVVPGISESEGFFNESNCTGRYYRRVKIGDVELMDLMQLEDIMSMAYTQMLTIAEYKYFRRVLDEKPIQSGETQGGGSVVKHYIDATPDSLLGVTHNLFGIDINRKGYLEIRCVGICGTEKLKWAAALIDEVAKELKPAV